MSKAAIGLQTGVWSGVLGLAGAGAVIVCPNQTWIGWLLIIAAGFLAAWGVKVGGEHWWARNRIRMTWPYALMAFCALGFAIGAIAAWRASPISVETSATPAGEATLNTPEVKDDAQQPTPLAATGAPQNTDQAAKPPSQRVYIECLRLVSAKTVSSDAPTLSFVLMVMNDRPVATFAISPPGKDINVANGSGSVDRCIITNYGPEPLTNVRILADVILNEVLPNGPGSTTSGKVVSSGPVSMKIDKIDPGKDGAQTFYIQNETKLYGNLEFRSASATILGETVERPLLLAHNQTEFGNPLWP